MNVRTTGSPCVPASNFVDTSPPKIDEDKMTARVERAVFNAPLSVVVAAMDEMPLEETIDPHSSLPFVTGTHNLMEGAFGNVGSRRYVCLSDGNGLVEQILFKETTDSQYVFRYQVWNYTSKQAAPVHYAIGEFVYDAASENETNVRWTYAFALRHDRMPGSLGGFGRWVFRKSFLDRDYAKMMRGTLSLMKARAETAGQAEAALPATQL